MPGQAIAASTHPAFTVALQISQEIGAWKEL